MYRTGRFLGVRLAQNCVQLHKALVNGENKKSNERQKVVAGACAKLGAPTAFRATAKMMMMKVNPF